MELRRELWVLELSRDGGQTWQAFFCPIGSQEDNEAALRDLAIDNIPRAVRKVLASVGWTPEQVDVVCCHQVTVDLIATIAAKTCIDPDKCVVSIADCGNTAAASIPIGLSRAYENGRLTPGAKVLLVGAAAGFSVGVIPVVW